MNEDAGCDKAHENKELRRVEVWSWRPKGRQEKEREKTGKRRGLKNDREDSERGDIVEFSVNVRPKMDISTVTAWTPSRRRNRFFCRPWNGRQYGDQQVPLEDLRG